jgi:hypothetical protein
MPLPPTQIDSLEEELAAHEQRLKVLRERIAYLTEEAYAHELIIRLGRNATLIEALAQAHDKPVVAEELIRDPQTFFRSRSIDLPDGARLAARDAEGTLEVSMRTGHGGWDYSCVWDASQGFSLIQHAIPGHRAVPGDQYAEPTTDPGSARN